MKILLVAVNASYMHTCLAVRSIYNFVKNQPNFDSNFQIDFAEFTINQPIMQILREISSSNADVVLFSSYIWNSAIIKNIILDVKKVLPHCVVGVGGPEASYSPEKFLKELSTLDFVMAGEGEILVYEFLNELKIFQDENSNLPLSDFFKSQKIFTNGIYFLDKNHTLQFSGNHNLIEDLDVIPFSYPELLTDTFDPDNKIYYYESSRGCPYSCSYCLSSVDKSVRFKSLKKVFAELKIFLDANVKLVKFVDRTYNLRPERYIEIWKYILENHNGKTMFHFEIEAEFLSDDALSFLQKVPSGVMQFEIGVQSANKKTLEKINRSPNIEKLAKNILQIPRTIHQHLDLIAGLPFEDLESFGKSFDFVMSLKPDALQLGFLKVLRGTQMENFAKQNGWTWQENAVYEVFSTPYLSFEDISFLKDIEVLVDEYWNKNIFSLTCKFIFRKINSWKFFVELCNFARSQKTFEVQRKDLYWFELLNNFFEFLNRERKIAEDDFLLLKNLLKYDFVSTGKKGNFPSWYNHIYDKEKHRLALEKNQMLHSTRLAFALTEFETFDFNVLSDTPELEKVQTEILIKYSERKK